MKRWMAVLAVAVLAWGAEASAALPQGVKQTAQVEGFTEYQLDNGMKLVLFPDPEKPSVVLNLVYRVGSRHEGPGTTGHAHLLEHMLFKGTPTVKDLPGEMRRRGINWNAFTTWDRTNYVAEMPAEGGALDWLLGLEAERMTQATFGAAEVAGEMTVVRNEFEIRQNNPYQSLDTALRGSVFHFHPYGRPPIGQLADIEQVDAARLRQLYRTYYRPDNAVLVIAGAFDVDHTLQRVAQAFGAVARPAEPLLQPAYTEPAQRGEREVTVHRVGGSPGMVVAYRVPAGRHPDAYALAMLANMLTHQGDGVLYERLVAARRATNLGANIDLLQDPGMLVVSAAPAERKPLVSAAGELVSLLEKDLPARLTEPLLAEVKQELKVGFERMPEQPRALALALTEDIAAGDWRLFFARRDGIAAVTLDDVKRVAATYLQRYNRTLGLYEPAGAAVGVDMPAPPPLAQQLSALKTSPTLSQGERIGTDPQALEARVERLSPRPGLKIAALRKRLRGDREQLALTLRFGKPGEVVGHPESRLLGKLLMQGDTGQHGNPLHRQLVELGTSLRVEAGPQELELTLDGPVDRLPQALRAAAAALHQPAWSEEAWALQKASAAGTWAGANSEPAMRMALMHAELHNRSRGLKPGDVDHAVVGKAWGEAVARLRLDDLKTFHAEVWGAGQVEVAAIGPLDAAAVQQLVEQAFADWPAGPPYERFVRRHVDVPGQRHHARIVDRPNADLDAVLYLPLDRRHPDRWAWELASIVLGGGPDSRLWKRLRDASGTSYSVSSALRVPSAGDAALLEVSASFPARQSDAVLQAVAEEVARARRDGVTPEELARARQALLQRRERQRADEGRLLETLQQQMVDGEGFAALAAEDAAIRAVTSADVQRVLQPSLDWSRFVVMTAGDFGADTGLGGAR